MASIAATGPEPKPEEKNPPLLAEPGAAGFKHWDGYVDEEFHRDLKGRKAARVYYEMSRNHPLVATGLRVIDLFARRVVYRVEPSGQTDLHHEAAELIETAIEDLPNGMPGVVSGASGCVTYGWAWLEKVFKISQGNTPSKYFRSKYNDNKIRWRKIRSTGQRTLEQWRLDDSGEVLGLWQRARPTFKLRFIPRSRAMHIKLYESDGSPEGISGLRPAYVPYYTQRQLQFTEAIGIYRNIAGFPLIEIPRDVAEAKEGPKYEIKLKYIDMAKKISADNYTCAVMPTEKGPDGQPTGYRLSLISASGKNNNEADVPIRRYRAEIAIVMMIMFMLLGEKAGSYNLGETQFEMLALAIEAVIDLALHAMNDDAVPELCELNGLPREVAPTITRGKIVPADLAKLGAFLQAGATAGFLTPDEPSEEWARNAADMPEQDAETQRAPNTSVPDPATLMSAGFGL